MKKLRNLGLAGILLFGCTEVNPDHNNIDAHKEVVDRSINGDDFDSQEDLAQNQNVDLSNVDSGEDSGSLEDMVHNNALPDYSILSDFSVLPDYTILKDMAIPPCREYIFDNGGDLNDFKVKTGNWTRHDQEGILIQTDKTNNETLIYSNEKYNRFYSSFMFKVNDGDYVRAEDVVIGFTFGYDGLTGYKVRIENWVGPKYDLNFYNEFNMKIGGSIGINGDLRNWGKMEITYDETDLIVKINDSEKYRTKNGLLREGAMGLISRATISRFDNLQICKK